MRDLERILRDALREQGETFEPSDPHRARLAFVERLRRRRRLAYLRTGGAIAAAALIAVVLVPGTLTEPDPIDLAGVTPEVVATIPVGGAPTSSSAAPDGAVWVATGNDVVAIDPEVNGVILSARTAGRSDELAATEDHVWVSTKEGHIYLVSSQSGSILGRTSVPRAQPLDIAARGGSLWAVGMTDGRLYETSAASGGLEEQAPGSRSAPVEDEAPLDDSPEPVPGDGEDNGLFLFEQQFEGMPLTDVAVGDAGLWVLFRGEDSAGVFMVDPEDITGGSTPIPVDAGASSDLAVGLHAVWVATGTNGTVERIDALTGEVTASVEVGGRYTDLAVGEGVVWALTGGDGAPRLYQIGADGDFIGDPLELEGDPVDVAVGAGAVWVSDHSSGEVLRIESRSQEPPLVDSPVPTPSAEVIGSDDILYVFATGAESGEPGDLYAQRSSGEVVRLTTTPELEASPAFAPDGKSLVFERREGQGDDVEGVVLIHQDLDTGGEQILAEGVSEAAFAPDGRLAFVRKPDGETLEVAIGAIEGRGGDAAFTEEMSIWFPVPEGLFAKNLHWSDDGGALYLETFGAGWHVHRLDLEGVSDGQEVEPEPVAADGMPDGSELGASTGVVGGGLDVLLLCCREDPPDRTQPFSIGRISFTDAGATYVPLPVEIPDGFDVSNQLDDLETLTGWSRADGGTWARDDTQAWLLSDGFGAWLIDESGSSRLPGTEDAERLIGLAVNPVLGAGR